MTQQNFGLGRGLSSLIPQKPAAGAPSPRQVAVPASVTPETDGTVAQRALPSGGEVLLLPASAIAANPRQPRLSFDKERLEELAASIKEHGVLQPLVVSPLADGRYELIAGERRLRASRLAGLATVPAIVRTADDQQKAELALIENLQRHDLNVIEEAKAYQQLADAYGLSQEDIATRVGKSRSAVANRLRLLHLPIAILKAVSDGRISEGHAKVILGLERPDQQHALYEAIVAQSMTVRQAERAAATIASGGGNTRPQRAAATVVAPTVSAAEKTLATALSARVTVAPRGKGGRVIIEYYAPEDLDALVDKIAHPGN